LTLSRSNQDAVLDLLGGIYDAALEPRLWDALMPRIAALVGAPAAGVRIEYGHGEAMRQHWVGLPTRFESLYVGGLWREDPWIEAARTIDVGRLVTGRGDLERVKPAIARSGFVNELIKPLGFSDVVGAVIIRDGQHLVTFSALHDGSDGAIEHHAAPLLRTLMPHVTRAMQLGLRAEHLERQVNELGSVAPFAIFFLDGERRLRFANGEGARLLETNDGLRLVGGRLVCGGPDEHARFERALTQRRFGVALRASRTRGGPLAVMLAVPQPGTIGLTRLFVVDPETTPRSPSNVLQVLYALTPAEARLALLIGEGLTPKEAADEVGVQVSTTRSQLLKVFEKCGVNRQSELVRLVAQLAPLVPRR